MDYKDYALETEGSLPTGIHTRINSEYGISSCYRRFSNPYFEKWSWETFLWKGDCIEVEYNILENADQVIDLHIKILKSFNK